MSKEQEEKPLEAAEPAQPSEAAKPACAAEVAKAKEEPKPAPTGEPIIAVETKTTSTCASGVETIEAPDHASLTKLEATAAKLEATAAQEANTQADAQTSPGQSANAQTSPVQEANTQADAQPSHASHARTDTDVKKTTIKIFVTIVSVLLIAIIACVVWLCLNNKPADQPAETATTTEENTKSTRDNTVASPQNSADMDEEENAAKAPVETALNKIIAGDASSMQEIASLADDDLYSQCELHFSDIGIDANEYALWATENLTYEISSVSVVEGSGSGLVYVEINSRNIFDFLLDFNDALVSYTTSDEYASETDIAVVKAKIGKLFNEAMEKANDDFSDDIGIFTVNKQAGKWSIDQASWDSELAYLFGLM